MVDNRKGLNDGTSSFRRSIEPWGKEDKEMEENQILTERQMEILSLVAQGKTYKEVAGKLYVTERTVKYHMGEILKKLHMRNRVQVIAYTSQLGLIDLAE